MPGQTDRQADKRTGQDGTGSFLPSFPLPHILQSKINIHLDGPSSPFPHWTNSLSVSIFPCVLVLVLDLDLVAIVSYRIEHV